MNSAASEHRHQDWHIIFLLSAASFFISWVLITILTWDTFTEWPSFAIHYPHVKNLVIQILDGKPIANNYYWNTLRNHGMEKHFIAHLLCPLALALSLAFLAGRIRYVKGGKECVRHISGPKFYSYGSAIAHSKKVTNNHEK